MSLEQRCQQFHEAAMGVGKSKGPVKEIATMRKFLHKNQDQRFTDKGVRRLFDTIQLYVHNEGVDLEYKESLLEDALKMPFTVFSTKQKKSMLKWLETLRGDETPGIAAGNAPGSLRKTFSLIDLVDGKLSLIDEDTGETYDDIPLPAGELGTAIQRAFEETDGVLLVDAQVENNRVQSILCLS